VPAELSAGEPREPAELSGLEVSVPAEPGAHKIGSPKTWYTIVVTHRVQDPDEQFFGKGSANGVDRDARFKAGEDPFKLDSVKVSQAPPKRGDLNANARSVTQRTGAGRPVR
jgi:hypothetical protein